MAGRESPAGSSARGTGDSRAATRAVVVEGTRWSPPASSPRVAGILGDAPTGECSADVFGLAALGPGSAITGHPGGGSGGPRRSPSSRGTATSPRPAAPSKGAKSGIRGSSCRGGGIVRGASGTLPQKAMSGLTAALHVSGTLAAARSPGGGEGVCGLGDTMIGAVGRDLTARGRVEPCRTPKNARKLVWRIALLDVTRSPPFADCRGSRRCWPWRRRSTSPG